jgi:putative isomerase
MPDHSLPRLLVYSASLLIACIVPAAVLSAQSASPSVNPAYRQVQQRLARGWNTWDVNSMTTQVLMPEGLAIQIGVKHNATEGGDDFLRTSSVGNGQVFPGPHAWDGSYTNLTLHWKGHAMRVESAHAGDDLNGNDLVLLVTPLAEEAKFSVPATIVYSVSFLWNHSGTAQRISGAIETHAAGRQINVYCTCSGKEKQHGDLPVPAPYFAADLTQPVAVSTGKRRSLAEIKSAIESARRAYEHSTESQANLAPVVDAIETTLGWDTIYEPSKNRVVSPVSRDWSVGWGGYVIFDWDTFFAATMASIGDRDLAYANAIETLHESTPEGFVPNYARAGDWKSSDRSEPPVGAITVLRIYQKFHERWFLEEAYPYLKRWNDWWAEHRDLDGYLTWGSDGQNEPQNLDDGTRGKREGAILESGLDNSPMYDKATFDSRTHLLAYADVGLMSMYIADCDALQSIAQTLDKHADADALQARAAKYKAKLKTLWSDQEGIFLNLDLQTGKPVHRLSPTNFYPMLAQVPTQEQARRMVEEHLKNPQEFWGEWVIPSIARNDPAFKDQDYWRGRIWGPMNYLVYLGLENYNMPETRQDFAARSFSLFLKEWKENGHVHENYNAILGTGDDVRNSDRFYHWGALLGYIEYLQESSAAK